MRCRRRLGVHGVVVHPNSESIVRSHRCDGLSCRTVGSPRARPDRTGPDRTGPDMWCSILQCQHMVRSNGYDGFSFRTACLRKFELPKVNLITRCGATFCNEHKCSAALCIMLFPSRPACQHPSGAIEVVSEHLVRCSIPQ